MTNFKTSAGAGITASVRNAWVRRTSEKSPPDSVLLDIGVVRDGCVEWNCAFLTPRRARAIAAALLKAAADTERSKGAA